MLECVNDWTEFLDAKEYVDVFYLDIRLYKLSRYGINGNLYDWIRAFLSNRVQAVRVDVNTSKYVNVASGVPQGSVIGPLLFLVYINDLVDVCKWASIKMFADDSKIYFKCRKLSDRQKLFHDVIRVFEWFETNQLKVAVEKCAVLHLGLSNPGFEYMNHNSIVPSVSRAKDIGVIVSSDMKFSDHCNEIAGKAFKMSNMFFKSRNKEFTTSFFKTYIRSLLENSTSVWNPYQFVGICSAEIHKTHSWPSESFI